MSQTERMANLVTCIIKEIAKSQVCCEEGRIIFLRVDEYFRRRNPTVFVIVFYNTGSNRADVSRLLNYVNIPRWWLIVLVINLWAKVRRPEAHKFHIGTINHTPKAPTVHALSQLGDYIWVSELIIDIEVNNAWTGLPALIER